MKKFFALHGTCIYIQSTLVKKRFKIPNQNPYIEDEQTKQWPKEKVQKDKQRSTKDTHKTKNRVKPGVNLGATEVKRVYTVDLVISVIDNRFLLSVCFLYIDELVFVLIDAEILLAGHWTITNQALLC